MINALMPGEHDWMKGPVASSAGGAWVPSASPMAGASSMSRANVPAQRRAPLMNALSGVGEFLLGGESYDKGRARRMDRQAGNALAMNDYEGAANIYLQGGALDQGMAVRELGNAYTEQQKAAEAEARKLEAQKTLQLFQSMQPEQINEFAMSDPAGFEEYTGMTSEEYLQGAQRMMQNGMTPEEFQQYVIDKAQTELGIDLYERQRQATIDAQNTELFGLQVDQYKRDAQGYRNATPEELVGYPKGTMGQVGPDGRLYITYEPPAPSGGAGDFGVTPVWGLDANGNRVLLQTSKSGGVVQAQLPEGVTLESPYDTAYGRTAGTTQAKKDAYKTEAGQAVLAAQAKADDLIANIDLAIEQSDFWNTGITSGAVWSGDFNATLDKIGAKAMLNELVAIKAQGGTLGALSDSEGKALRDAAVAISKSQSEKQLDANLKAYRLQVQRSMDLIRQAYESEYESGRFGSPSGSPDAPQATAGPQPGDIENGYEFMGGDPADPNSWRPASGARIKF